MAFDFSQQVLGEKSRRERKMVFNGGCCESFACSAWLRMPGESAEEGMEWRVREGEVLLEFF